MIQDYNHILAKSAENGFVPLTLHLQDVATVAVCIARHTGMDEDLARKGALLHDIGKVSPEFQRSLKSGFVRRPGEVFRHEIASLFFISLVELEAREAVVEMIAAHHKSIRGDVRDLGLLDLDDKIDSFETHSKGFENWSTDALSLLAELGMETHPISLDEAKSNYDYAVSMCEGLKANCSKWKGLLMAADHFASALNDKAEQEVSKLFIRPDLSFYERKNPLYPLSLLAADDERKHTLVTAPTGAGKTDFLLRRCRGRVFYTLPFQASINAMYDRIRTDLHDTDAQVRLLHAASSLKIGKDRDGRDKLEESILQRHVGASIKVLTPHQMASIVFGIKGYEAMAMDLRGCDVILDEIHTYSDVIQAIVLRIVEILVRLGCRVHVGTATMPTVLYGRILEIFGGEEQVYEVKLPEEVLETFNRHIIHKVRGFDDCRDVMEEAVADGRKILIVYNQVKRSQEMYLTLKERYPNIPSMLIHSRFKRGQRNRLEMDLKDRFNAMDESCIVVSTQVVEVSLDISFDLMITECAPIDAMIQRFGRINRKRSAATIGHFKPIYVLAPPENKEDALPYSLEVLQRSFAALPDGTLMKEVAVRDMLDAVYPKIEVDDINYSGVAFADGRWILKELRHQPKSALMDTLEIDSAVCITESDRDSYKRGNASQNAFLEIPVRYRSVGFRKLEQLDTQTRPFVIPDKAYSEELGLLIDLALPEHYKSFEFI